MKTMLPEIQDLQQLDELIVKYFTYYYNCTSYDVLKNCQIANIVHAETPLFIHVQ